MGIFLTSTSVVNEVIRQDKGKQFNNIQANPFAMHVIISKVLQHSAVNCRAAHTVPRKEKKKEMAAAIQVFLP